MTAKQITDKIALLKEAMKKEKIKSVKDKIKNKIEDLRQQAKTSNISTTQLAKSLLGSQSKVSRMTDAELRDALKQLRPRSEYSFLKLTSYRSLPKVKDDLDRYAKPVGWRIKGRNNVHKPTPKELEIAKKKGKAYYEDRPNRSDVVRPAKLEDGGMMAEGGNVEKGASHIYITQTKGKYKVYHGDGVSVKKNAPILLEREGVKEGTWEKLWEVLRGK